MAKISLVRIDSRLIHGQVITKWLKIACASRIIIVDDFLSQDPFMTDIYKMSAPKGVKVEIYSTDEGARLWNENNFGDGTIFLLFKNMEMCYEAYKKGLKFKQLQIGGIPSAPGKKMIFTAVSFDDTDVKQLKELNDAGVEIKLHIVPEEQSLSFENALKKYNS